MKLTVILIKKFLVEIFQDNLKVHFQKLVFSGSQEIIGWNFFKSNPFIPKNTDDSFCNQCHFPVILATGILFLKSQSIASNL